MRPRRGIVLAQSWASPRMAESALSLTLGPSAW